MGKFNSACSPPPAVSGGRTNWSRSGLYNFWPSQRSRVLQGQRGKGERGGPVKSPCPLPLPGRKMGPRWGGPASLADAKSRSGTMSVPARLDWLTGPRGDPDGREDLSEHFHLGNHPSARPAPAER
ncbi:hypothetical protein GQ53DRAFT_411345 [Thozetella sp. PMI_491]|nr:hypothetical protein GQ53DRAFT_411345 [Thozetella sp. PMI_491]